MWIDETKLSAEINKVLPIVEAAIELMPGSEGETAVEFLKAFSSDTVLKAEVDLLNQITGAKPPTA